MAITDFVYNPTTIAEVLALAAAIIFLPVRKAGYPGLFVYYLLAVVLIEASGFYLRTVVKVPNTQLYNFLMLVQAMFFCYVFYRYHTSRSTRRWIAGSLVLFLVFFVAETIYRSGDSLNNYNRYCRIILGIQVIVFSCSFYFALLRDDSVRQLLLSGSFWIVTGLFFYYLCSTPMFTFYKEISKIKLSGSVSFYNLVMGCINAILYGSWIIAFICIRKNLSSNRSLSFHPS